MEIKEFKRVVIEKVTPVVNNGDFPAKRVIHEECVVEADIFIDGHESLAADLFYKPVSEKNWQVCPFKFIQNDRWQASFTPNQTGSFEFYIEAWEDQFGSFQNDFKKKFEAGIELTDEFIIGAIILERFQNEELKSAATKLRSKKGKSEKIEIALSKELHQKARRLHKLEKETTKSSLYKLEVSRAKALFSTWYELFPRSCTDKKETHGTFLEVIKELPRLSKLGFDVLYFPPIHPIGKTKRKGKNNSLVAESDDPGSPWAVGSKEGGHEAIHPELGTINDLKKLIKEAQKYNIEIALDIAFQCSLDHPYIKAHPEWFIWRPDGTIQYAENPPKKYEDIVPFNFHSKDREGLFKELLNVVLYWVKQGIKIFRVDNPHTKPFPFWAFLINEVKAKAPDVLFLSEAFTRPKVMQRLAKIGFDQSYTYFTWRNSKYELQEYMTELTKTEIRNYFRPNFWVNTPDILPEHLQYGGKTAFLSRLLLAATLSSNYGMYGPVFELMMNEAISGKEEYRDSEKYEIKPWRSCNKNKIDDFIALVNRIRKENKALQTPWNIEFYPLYNDFLLAFGKYGAPHENDLLVIVNLDFENTQSGFVELPLEKLGLDPVKPFMVHELLTDHRYIWKGRQNYVEIRPKEVPGHIFKILKETKREQNFDYYM